MGPSMSAAVEIVTSTRRDETLLADSPPDTSQAQTGTQPSEQDCLEFVDSLLCPHCPKRHLWTGTPMLPAYRETLCGSPSRPFIRDELYHVKAWFDPQSRTVSAQALLDQQNLHTSQHTDAANMPLEILKTILRDINPRVILVDVKNRAGKQEYCHFTQLPIFHASAGEKTTTQKWRFEPGFRPREDAWFDVQCKILMHEAVFSLPDIPPLSILKALRHQAISDDWNGIGPYAQVIDGYIQASVKSLGGELPYPS